MIDYTVLATEEQVLRTADAIRARGIDVEIVETGADALERIQQLIPPGASVMTGASQTLRDIGLEDILIAKDHDWANLKDEILSEQDTVKQMKLRRQSTLSDYYLGSAVCRPLPKQANWSLPAPPAANSQPMPIPARI